MMMNSSYNNNNNNKLLSASNIGGDDYIGSESTCMDLQNDIVDEEHKYYSKTTSHDHDAASAPKSIRSSSGKSKVLREFPPPITLLSSSSSNHLSWALRRHCTSDGRLILKEEKLNNKHCGYFRAHRSNGRLILQLVHHPLFFPLEQEEQEEEEEDNYGVADPHDHHNM